jgi:type I restriction enzyme S subunit
MYGATIGKVGILTFPATTNQACCACVEYEALQQLYLFYFLLSHKENFIRQGGGGAQPNISKEKIVETLLPLPPFNEQKRIVNEVEKWFAIIEKIESGTIQLESYIKQTKSKILDLALSGKLVPQDPNDEPAIELLRRVNPNFQPCDNSHYENLPQGWAVCRLEDILDYEQPQAYIVDSTDYSDEYETPVLTAGKSFIIGYANETNGICNRLPVIIFDDFTTDSKLVDFPFKVKSSAMKILRTRGEINIDYIAYYMSITRLIGDTHKRYWISEYSKLLIPIPPYQEQLRIVETVETIFNEILKITAELS